jgi:DNA mismatch repair protein MutS
MRERLAQAKKLDYYRYAMERCFLGAVEIYCEAVEGLSRDLCPLDVQARGLRAFREYLAEYISSVSFQNLATEVRELKLDLSAIRYSLLIKDGSLTVHHNDRDSDYSTAVEETFEKFRSGTTNHYWLEMRKWEGMNHIEGQIQDGVALLYPVTFSALDDFCAVHAEYLAEKISRFDHEIQFYVAYLTYIDKFRCKGLSFCQPELSQSSKEI